MPMWGIAGSDAVYSGPTKPSQAAGPRDGEHAYRNPVGNQVALIDDQDHLLVRLLLPDVLQYRFAQRSQGIPRVENVKNHVGGVYNLVEFPVYPS